MSHKPRLADKELYQALELASELIPEFQAIKKGNPRNLPILFATVFDSLAHGEMDLDFNTLRWTIETYAGMRLIRLVDPLLKAHAELVKRGYNYESPLEYNSGDRYVGFIEDPLDDWSILSFRSQHPGFIVLVRQGRKDLRQDCARWEAAGENINMHKADLLTREIHIRLADKRDGSLYKILSHGENCFLVSEAASSPVFRYADFRDESYVISATEESYGLYKAEGAMVHWKDMNRAVFDICCLIENLQEVLEEEL